MGRRPRGSVDLVAEADDKRDGADAPRSAPSPLIRLAASMPELDILRLFGNFVAERGASLDDPGSHDAFVERVVAALQNRKLTTIHGLRIETMFAYVAAALGECSTITAIDSGLFLADDRTLRRPDYHIITTAGPRFLVEVKNHSPNESLALFEMKTSYLSTIERYAERFGCDLKVAVYWRQAGMWTLVDARYFDRGHGRATLSLEAAMKRNEMATLGDRAIATVPPLALRVYTDSEKPRRVGDDGSVEITVERVAVCAAGMEITNPIERRIASFLLWYGGWSRVERIFEIRDGEVIWFDVAVAPEECDESETTMPPLLGWLSAMISRKYGEMTVADGSVSLLSPDAEPSSLGIVIPPNYRGQVLRLWQLHLRPNYDGFVEAPP